MTARLPPASFGWIMPSGAFGVEGRAAYVADIERGLRLIAGHFDSAWMSDHLQFGTADRLDGWTALTYFAARHPNLQFGHAVLCQSYRNPALLAKMAATLQALTGGRYQLGLGAGWHEEEYRAYNYPFPSAVDRVTQLAETAQIIRALWIDAPATVTGRHYAVTEAYCEPRPDPAPPITIAAWGPRMLQVTAQYADWWDIGRETPESYAGYVDLMDAACQAVGRDPATLRRSIWFSLCACARTEEEAIARAGKAYGQEPGLVGTPAQLVAQIQRYRALGAERFELGSYGFPDLETLELLVHEVLPALRAGDPDP
ncbi:MAG TPA: LLM class flavin-dependent oxidoreductase [Chloroflexia bacterium]|nr:LLM class flavin-dependent oxidoreductase [Chloroflexia bacterium]